MQVISHLESKLVLYTWVVNWLTDYLLEKQRSTALFHSLIIPMTPYIKCPANDYPKAFQKVNI